jgi:hypothetical protein
MKIIRLIVITGIVLCIAACGSKKGSINIVNSNSFAEQQITVGGYLAQRIGPDSVRNAQKSDSLNNQLKEILSATETLKESKSDSSWVILLKRWEEFRMNVAVLLADTSANSVFALQEWAKINIELLKLTSEVRFGDALEKLIYESKVPVLSERLIKSIIYTRIDDQIFINLIGSSSVNHHHTTGGTIKLIQETDYPPGNEITLKCECSDVRYLDVFIRIPEWAVNPTVTHGNVKYVAHPGEYCQVFRKWQNGDLFNIKLKN